MTTRVCVFEGPHLPVLEWVEEVDLVARETGVAEMVTDARGTAVTLASYWTDMAVRAGHAQVEGLSLGSQPLC